MISFRPKKTGPRPLVTVREVYDKTCAVARAQLCVQFFVLRQQQHTSGRIEPIAPDDDRAVMQRRTLIKYRSDHLRRNIRIDDRACLYNII